MIQHPSKQKLRPPTTEFVNRFKLELFYEFQAQILVGLFFLCAFAIVHFLQFTLISLLMASQLFALIGGTAFLLFYLLRNKFKIGLLDGLYYSTFTVAPCIFALFLWVNSSCADLYQETHRTKHTERGGSGFVYELENDAYEEFWRIRNFDSETVHVTKQTITYTFCDGLFGYKVMKDARFD